MRTLYFDNIPAHCPFQLLQDSPPGLPSNFMFSYFIIIIFIYHGVKGKQKENNPKGKDQERGIAVPRTRNQEGND